jgi:hypothetical protein
MQHEKKTKYIRPEIVELGSATPIYGATCGPGSNNIGECSSNGNGATGTCSSGDNAGVDCQFTGNNAGTTR